MSRQEIVNKSGTSSADKFKVGDVVERIEEEHLGMKVGDRGTIIELVSGDSIRLREYEGTHATEFFKLITGSVINSNEIEIGDTVKRTRGDNYGIKQGENFVVVDIEYPYVIANRGNGNRKHDPINLTIVRKGKEPMKVPEETTWDFKNLLDVCSKQTASTEANINSKGDLNMTQNVQRKTVTVNLIDRDASLDEKHSLVATFGQFMTSKSNEALIRSIIMEPKNEVAKLIEQHNEVRTKQINKEILQRTGNKVHLEPVEESDLYWEIL